MTTYNLNEEDKKRLTKFLGEKYIINEPCPLGCKHCDPYCSGGNRPFNTYQDQGDLCEKLVETGEWEKFDKGCFDLWKIDYKEFRPLHLFSAYLMTNPKRTIWLINEFLKGGATNKD